MQPYLARSAIEFLGRVEHIKANEISIFLRILNDLQNIATAAPAPSGGTKVTAKKKK